VDILKIILGGTLIISMLAFQNSSMLNRMMFIPYDCKNNKNYSRFYTHMFIHADWMHLLFNMISLYFLGDALLNAPPFIYQNVNGGLVHEFGLQFGQLHFVLMYLFGGLFSTIIPYFRNKDNPNYRSLGASGAVSAVIFASIIWNPGMELQLMFIPVGIPAYIFGPLYLLYEYWADKKGSTGIAHDAHIGGAVFGIFYILLIDIDKGKAFFNYFTI
jgi:membrane associated rhomboid family serine protease